MSANNITQKCQRAAREYIAAQVEALPFIQDPETQIVTGIHRGELQLTTVICQCKTATPETVYEGNWTARLRVEIRSNIHDDGTDDGDNHFENAGALFALFMIGQVEARQAISNADIGFTCQQLTVTEQGWDIEEQCWMSYMDLNVECAGTYFDVS